jgi:hypothetical protein
MDRVDAALHRIPWLVVVEHLTVVVAKAVDSKAVMMLGYYKRH